MTGGSVTGVIGQIKWHYYVAAQIHTYRVTRSPAKAWTLSGMVGVSDAFKLAQKPLVFVAPTAKGAWFWPITELSIENGRLTAKLGDPIP